MSPVDDKLFHLSCSQYSRRKPKHRLTGLFALIICYVLDARAVVHNAPYQVTGPLRRPILAQVCLLTTMPFVITVLCPASDKAFYDKVF